MKFYSAVLISLFVMIASIIYLDDTHIMYVSDYLGIWFISFVLVRIALEIMHPEKE